MPLTLAGAGSSLCCTPRRARDGIPLILWAAGRCSGSAGRPVWLTVRQPLLYQGRRCLLRICGRKTLPAPSLVAGPRRVGGAGVCQAAAQ